MTLAVDMGRHSGRATPSLHDGPYRQFETATGGRSTYPLPNPVQTNPTTSVLEPQALQCWSHRPKREIVIGKPGQRLLEPNA